MNKADLVNEVAKVVNTKKEAQAAVDSFKKCFDHDSDEYSALHLMEARLRGMEQEIEEQTVA